MALLIERRRLGRGVEMEEVSSIVGIGMRGGIREASSIVVTEDGTQEAALMVETWARIQEETREVWHREWAP